MSRIFRSARIRLIIIFLVPAIIFSSLAYGFSVVYFEAKFATQVNRYGQATAQQISHLVAEYVMHEDILSLTVFIAQLQSESQIESLEVYNADNQLLAQAGRDSRGPSFTHELNYQDSMIGYLRLTVTPVAERSNWLLAPIALLALGILFTGMALWLVGDFIYLWLFATSDNRQPKKKPLVDAHKHDDEDHIVSSKVLDKSLLVLKIRPARYLNIYVDRIVAALDYYEGDVSQMSGDELVVNFDSVEDAVTAGLLVKKLIDRLSGSITFGGAIDLVASADKSKLKKQNGFLASIASGNLLLTTAANSKLPADWLETQVFRSALIDANNLLQADRLTDDSSLQVQARDLSKK